MERNKLPKILWVLTVVAIVSLFISLITLVIAIHSPSGNSYPRETQVESAPVDYSKISAIVQQQIAAEPKAIDGVSGAPGQNGSAGKNGTDGTNGTSGTSGINGVQGVIGEEGIPGRSGPQGDPGIPGAQIELQYNAVKSDIEWRYNTQLNWQSLVSACTLLNTCVSP